MKKQLFLFGLFFSLASQSYAQFSAGVMAGAGYQWERQTSSSPNSTFGGVGAAQPPVLGGVYGQYATKGKWGIVGGLQLRYQQLRQSQRFLVGGTSAALSEPQYNKYNYLVATPYVGIRPFGRLEIAVGPEISYLLGSKLVSFNRNPTQWITGYNVKGTYWFGRFGVEGGYSYQSTAFDKNQSPDGQTVFNFFNKYAYGALKYNLIQK
jgi:hypothetical protein